MSGFGNPGGWVMHMSTSPIPLATPYPANSLHYDGFTEAPSPSPSQSQEHPQTRPEEHHGTQPLSSPRTQSLLLRPRRSTQDRASLSLQRPTSLPGPNIPTSSPPPSSTRMIHNSSPPEELSPWPEGLATQPNGSAPSPRLSVSGANSSSSEASTCFHTPASSRQHDDGQSCAPTVYYPPIAPLYSPQLSSAASSIPVSSQQPGCSISQRNISTPMSSRRSNGLPFSASASSLQFGRSVRGPSGAVSPQTSCIPMSFEHFAREASLAPSPQHSDVQVSSQQVDEPVFSISIPSPVTMPHSPSYPPPGLATTNIGIPISVAQPATTSPQPVQLSHSFAIPLVPHNKALENPERPLKRKRGLSNARDHAEINETGTEGVPAHPHIRHHRLNNFNQSETASYRTQVLSNISPNAPTGPHVHGPPACTCCKMITTLRSLLLLQDDIHLFTHS